MLQYLLFPAGWPQLMCEMWMHRRELTAKYIHKQGSGIKALFAFDKCLGLREIYLDDGVRAFFPYDESAQACTELIDMCTCPDDPH